MTQVSRFSVVVPAYNAAATIGETLASVLTQGFDSWECIVVNDGSTDETADIAREYAERDRRFRLVEQENQGASAAHNAGVRASSGECVVLLAADDFLLPAHMQVMDDLITRHPEYGVFSCNGYVMQHETREMKAAYARDEWLSERSISFEELADTCFFSVGACYRRSLVEEVGAFRPGSYVDDYDFWLRAFVHGEKHRYTPEILAVHRVSDFQQSAAVVRVWESDIAAFRRLLETKRLTPAQTSVVQDAIRTRERRIAEYGRRLLPDRRQDLRKRMERNPLGRALAKALMWLMQRGRDLRWRIFSGK